MILGVLRPIRMPEQLERHERLRLRILSLRESKIPQREPSFFGAAFERCLRRKQAEQVMAVSDVPVVVRQGAGPGCGPKTVIRRVDRASNIVVFATAENLKKAPDLER